MMSPSSTSTSAVPEELLNQEVVEHYYQALLDLKAPDRIYIHTLTEIALDNSGMFANETVFAIEQRIQDAPRKEKIPAWYLMDSIVKVPNSPYKALFQRNLPKLIVQCMDFEDTELNRVYTELLAIWNNVFPPEVFQEVERLIEAQLNGRQGGGARGTSNGSMALSSSQLPAAMRSIPTGNPLATQQVTGLLPKDAVLDDNLTMLITELVSSLNDPNASLPSIPNGFGGASSSSSSLNRAGSPLPTAAIIAAAAIGTTPKPLIPAMTPRATPLRVTQLVLSLYSKKQACPQCAMRFDAVTDLVLHKDKHFASSWKRKATSRRWYLSPEEWSGLMPRSTYDAVAPLADILENSQQKRRGSGAFHSTAAGLVASSSSASINPSPGIGVPTGGGGGLPSSGVVDDPRLPGLPDVTLSAGDDRDYRCSVCGEALQKLLNVATGEWYLANSALVRKGNPDVACHKGCYRFTRQASPETEPAAKLRRLT